MLITLAVCLFVAKVARKQTARRKTKFIGGKVAEMGIFVVTEYAVLHLKADRDGFFAVKIMDRPGYALEAEAKFENGMIFRGKTCELQVGKPMKLGDPKVGGIVTTTVMDVTDALPIPVRPKVRVPD